MTTFSNQYVLASPAMIKPTLATPDQTLPNRWQPNGQTLGKHWANIGQTLRARQERFGFG